MLTLTEAKTLAYLLVLLTIGYAIFYKCLSRQARKEIGFQPPLVAAALNLLAFLLPNLLYVNVAYFLLPLLLVRKPEQAGLVFIIGFLTTSNLTQNLHLGDAYLFPGYTVHVSLAVGCYLAFLMKGGKADRKRRFSADAAAAIILLLVFIQGARGTAWTHWAREFASLTFVWFLPYYLVTRSLSSPEGVRKACLWLAGVGAMLSVLLLYEMFAHWSLFQPLDYKFDIGRSGATYKIRLGLMRAQGPLGEPTAMGIALVFCLGGALASRMSFRGGGTYAAICILIAVGLLAPQSRGGWLGAAILLSLYGIYRAAPGKAAGLVLPGLLALPLALAGITYGSGNEETLGTVDYRARLWDRGIEEFQKNPLFGIDLQTIRTRLRDLTQGEGIIDIVNSHLYFALIGGVIGLLAFIYAFLAPAVTLWAKRRKFPVRSFERDLAGFCFGALLAAVVMFGFTSFMVAGGLLVIIACGFAGTLVSSRRPVGAQARSKRVPIWEKAAEPEPDQPVTAQSSQQ